MTENFKESEWLKVSMIGNSPTLKNSRARILETVGRLPRWFCQKLADCGLEIVIAPAFEESLADKDLADSGWHHRLDRCNYKLYVEERPVNGYGDYIEVDVLEGCARAFDHVTGFTDTEEFVAANAADLEGMPEEVRGDFAWHRQHEAGFRAGTFARLFSALLVLTQEQQALPMLGKLKSAYPWTSKMVISLLDE